MGMTASIWIDDGIIASPTIEQCKYFRDIVRSDLRNSGWRWNSKSDWELKQTGEYLGFIIDTIRFVFSIPEKKIKKLKDFITSLLNNPKWVLVRDICRFTGFLNSWFIAIGREVHLFSKHLNTEINNSAGYNSHVKLSPGSIKELKFWLEHIDALKGYPIRRIFSCKYSIYVDAAEYGFGGYITLKNIAQNPIFQHFEIHEIGTSSTYRELKAIFKVIVAYTSILQNEKVKIYCDNDGAVSILGKGSPKPHLNDLSKNIFSHCIKFNIAYEGQWIPRTLNDKADFLSKCYDPDDYQLNPILFRMLSNIFGKFDIDRMADDSNHQLPLFNSKWYSNKSIAIDTYTQDWGGVNNYCFRAPNDVIQVINHMKFCKARGCVIIPDWIGHKHNPVLLSCKHIEKVWTLPKIKNMFTLGNGAKCLYKTKASKFDGTPSFDVKAYYFNFSTIN